MKLSGKGRVAIVTGSDRGLGYEVSRQLGERGFRIVLTSPDRKRGEASAAKLRSSGSGVLYHQLDVADEKSVQALRNFVLEKFRSVDVLVNNAGVLLDEGRSALEGILARRRRKRPRRVDFGDGPGVLDVDIEIVRATLEINTLGALRMCQAFMPLMIKKGYGRVVNVSSSRGQLSGMTDEGAPAYQLSKAALNAVTLMAADAARGSNVQVNSVCPGWTRTNLGGPEAPQSVEEGAETIVWLATRPDSGPTGGFFQHKERIEW